MLAFQVGHMTPSPLLWWQRTDACRCWGTPPSPHSGQRRLHRQPLPPSPRLPAFFLYVPLRKPALGHSQLQKASGQADGQAAADLRWREGSCDLHREQTVGRMPQLAAGLLQLPEVIKRPALQVLLRQLREISPSLGINP